MSRPTTYAPPVIREVAVPMAPAAVDPIPGLTVTARLIIRGVHPCEGNPRACAEECLVAVTVVLIDPDAGPRVERPYTGGWVEPDNVEEIITALWTAAATPTPDVVTR